MVDIQIAETIVHENYVPTSSAQGDDIALIRLSQAAPYTDYIRPICLPTDESLRNKNYDELLLDVAGFGRTEYGMLCTGNQMNLGKMPNLIQLIKI